MQLPIMRLNVPNIGATRRCTRPPTAPFAAFRSQARYTALIPLPAAGELVVGLRRAAWSKAKVKTAFLFTAKFCIFVIDSSAISGVLAPQRFAVISSRSRR